ncbi:hypothetical protein ACWDTP_36330 [Mycobacterium sp. NPDC003449]
MWVIELNVAGRRFTRQVWAPRRSVFALRSRALLRRPARLPLDRAA